MANSGIKSADPKRKAFFFGLLSDIEREHYGSLKDTGEFSVDPAVWYQRAQNPKPGGA